MCDTSGCIIAVDNYLHNITDSRIVYCGSCALLLNGIKIDREPHDVDVRLIDLNYNDLVALYVDNAPTKIDKLVSDKLPLEYNELQLDDRTILVQTPKNALLWKFDTIVELYKSGCDYTKHLKDIEYLINVIK